MLLDGRAKNYYSSKRKNRFCKINKDHSSDHLLKCILEGHEKIARELYRYLQNESLEQIQKATDNSLILFGIIKRHMQ